MIKLRKLEINDAGGMLEWMQDEEVSKYLNIPEENKTMNSVMNFIESAQDQSKHCHFAITDEVDHYCGTVSLKNINTRDKHAEFAIVIPRRCNGMGYGNQAIKLVKDYAASELKLHKIYLNVYEHNPVAIHVYEKNGFKLMGRLEDHICKDGQYASLLYYELMLEGDGK